MSYDALGVDYPELPFVEKESSPKAIKATSTQPSAAPGIASKAATDMTRAVASPTKRSRPASKTQAADSPAASTLRPHPSAKSASPAKTQAHPEAAPRGAARSNRAARLVSLANPNDFHPAEYIDNDYRIRGGGKRHNRRSPAMVILMALVIIIGIGLLGVFLWNAFNNLLGEKPLEQVITLSASETRDAVDSEMPVLLNYIHGTADDAYAAFVEAGWNVLIPGRETSDNPDQSAAGSEIIHLAPGVDPTVLDEGYYASEFDAYDYDELQASFNGIWALDITQGDLGGYAQLKYINFVSDSLTEEFQYLRGLQGLDGVDTVVLTPDGSDNFGNSYIQGYTVIEGTTYFWKIIGIAFGDYYGGQDRRDLPETAVFVKCTIATFDFYGAALPSPDETDSTEETGSTEETASTEETDSTEETG
jgi:hypothetical protein